MPSSFECINGPVYKITTIDIKALSNKVHTQYVDLRKIARVTSIFQTGDDIFFFRIHLVNGDTVEIGSPNYEEVKADLHEFLKLVGEN